MEEESRLVDIGTMSTNDSEDNDEVDNGDDSANDKTNHMRGKHRDVLEAGPSHISTRLS